MIKKVALLIMDFPLISEVWCDTNLRGVVLNGQCVCGSTRDITELEQVAVLMSVSVSSGYDICWTRE